MAVTDSEQKRCDNLACICQVTLAQTTCGPYCDTPEGRDLESIRCRCGHAGCEAEMEEQLHGGIGRESL